MKIVDVDILLYAVNQQSQFHAQALAWWNAALGANEIVGLPWITVSGFLRIATNWRLFDKPLTVAEAHAASGCVDGAIECSHRPRVE
jgi:predicted nucleic acid-binding protein